MSYNAFIEIFFRGKDIHESNNDVLNHNNILHLKYVNMKIILKVLLPVSDWNKKFSWKNDTKQYSQLLLN